MKFIHKPTIVKAEQWFPGKPIKGVREYKISELDHLRPGHVLGAVETKDVYQYAEPGDWIVVDPQGDASVCPDAVFRNSYDPAPPSEWNRLDQMHEAIWENCPFNTDPPAPAPNSERASGGGEKESQ